MIGDKTNTLLQSNVLPPSHDNQHSVSDAVVHINLSMHRDTSCIIGSPSLKRRGMVVTFQDVEYTVVNRSNKKQKLTLLKDVTGFFEPAQMAALMGPSGSGKTTLLDVLAGRKTQGDIRGTILFSQRIPSRPFLRRYAGYVEQFDTLLDMLTVREMLMYTAELKRPTCESHARKQAVVDDLLSKLALDDCQNMHIGSVLHRGISGGQAKRTNIGIALVTSPRVLFLDEPTSGLDSYTANEVMTVVKGLCADGVTICATVHAPSQYLFDLFDKAIMLLRGQVVYFGPQDTALQHFKLSSPHIRSSVPTDNDAEWLTDVTVKADRQGRGNDFVQSWLKSQVKQDMDALLRQHLIASSAVHDDTIAELNVTRSTGTPMWWALKTLFKYRTLANYRSPHHLLSRIGDKLLFTLVIISLYYKTGEKMQDANEVQSIVGFFYMWSVLASFGACTYVPNIFLERALYVRERNDGMYNAITYLCSKVVDELLLMSVVSLAFSAMVFFAVHLQGNFALFWMLYLGCLANSIVLAYLVTAAAPSMEVAINVLPAYIVALLFFAGFFINLKNIPGYWRWFAYIDFVRYAWSAQMVNQFGNVPEAQIDGRHVLDYYDLSHAETWDNFGWLLLFFVAFFVLAWITLAFKVYQRR